MAKVVSDLGELLGKFKYASGHAEALSRAKTAHLAWKNRLRSFLYGNAVLSEAEAVSHHDCAFGRWYYGEGIKAMGDIIEMRQIEGPHAELHRVIKKIVKHYHSDRKDLAEQGLERVDQISKQIVELLDIIKEKQG